MNEHNLILALNAAEARVQFVIARLPEDGKAAEILCAQDWAAPSRGTEILPAAVEQAFSLLGMNPKSLSRIACVSGPGSFTGIRLVLAFAAALRRTTGATLSAVNYLQLLAASLPFTGQGVDEGMVRVLTHARRGLVHCQDFRLSCGNMPEPLGQPDMASVTQAAEGLEQMGSTQPVWLIGSGVTKNFDTLRPLLPAQCKPLAHVADHPLLSVLLTQALGAVEEKEDLQPLYLRPCDAEDNLPHIAEQRGQSPEEAKSRLAALLAEKPAPLHDSNLA